MYSLSSFQQEPKSCQGCTQTPSSYTSSWLIYLHNWYPISSKPLANFTPKEKLGYGYYSHMWDQFKQSFSSEGDHVQHEFSSTNTWWEKEMIKFTGTTIFFFTEKKKKKKKCCKCSTVYNWTKISFTLYKLSNCLLHKVGMPAECTQMYCIPNFMYRETVCLLSQN